MAFGRFSPVTWEPWEEPIVIGHRLYCDKTFFEFDLLTGYSEFCIDRLPTYRVTIAQDGELFLESDSDLVPSHVYFQCDNPSRSHEEKERNIVIGWSEASAELGVLANHAAEQPLQCAQGPGRKLELQPQQAPGPACFDEQTAARRALHAAGTHRPAQVRR